MTQAEWLTAEYFQWDGEEILVVDQFAKLSHLASFRECKGITQRVTIQAGLSCQPALACHGSVISGLNGVEGYHAKGPWLISHTLRDFATSRSHLSMWALINYIKRTATFVCHIPEIVPVYFIHNCYGRISFCMYPVEISNCCLYKKVLFDMLYYSIPLPSLIRRRVFFGCLLEYCVLAITKVILGSEL